VVDLPDGAVGFEQRQPALGGQQDASVFPRQGDADLAADRHAAQAPTGGVRKVQMATDDVDPQQLLLLDKPDGSFAEDRGSLIDEVRGVGGHADSASRRGRVVPPGCRAMLPPSTGIVTPVMNAASSLSRYMTSGTMS